MALFAASFPSSLYMLKKYFGLHKDCFQKFVVCPKCNSLYNYDSAYEKVGGRRLSRKYSFVEFPNHRQRAHRKSCNDILLKEVKLQDGKLKLYPEKVYCYNSIIETLKTFSPTPWTVASKREDQHTKFIPVQRIQWNFVATVQKWKGGNDLFLSRNSLKTSFGVGRLLAKVWSMPVKCSFIIFGIRVFILVVVLLFDCLRQLIFLDVFFLQFKRVFIPSQVFLHIF